MWRGLLVVLAMSTAWGQKRPPEYEIRAVRAKSNQAMTARDLKAFADTLGEDFTATRGNGTAVKSKPEYVESFAERFKDPKAIRFERITDSVELSAAGPLAAEHGHWIGTLADGHKAFGGTYLAMWRRIASGWKIRSELYVVLSCDDKAACAAYTK